MFVSNEGELLVSSLDSFMKAAASVITCWTLSFFGYLDFWGSVGILDLSVKPFWIETSVPVMEDRLSMSDSFI